MRNFILFSIGLLSLAGCLKHDVLDKDLDKTNFQESDFYTSGDFSREFGFTVENVDLKTIVNPIDPNDILCKPTYTLRLNDDFVSDLSKEWSHEIVLKLYEDQSTFEEDSVTYSFHVNYGQSFEFVGKAIECNATSSDLDARIILIAPNNGRATATLERRTIPITFNP